MQPKAPPRPYTYTCPINLSYFRLCLGPRSNGKWYNCFWANSNINLSNWNFQVHTYTKSDINKYTCPTHPRAPSDCAMETDCAGSRDRAGKGQKKRRLLPSQTIQVLSGKWGAKTLSNKTGVGVTFIEGIPKRKSLNKIKTKHHSTRLLPELAKFKSRFGTMSIEL